MTKNDCPVCHKESATKHPLLGILPGKKCQKRRLTQSIPDVQIEFVPESLKSERKEFGKSIVQPFRGGVLSKEYIEAHGTKGIKVTTEQVKNAKNVWSEDYSKNYILNKSK